MEPEEFKEHQKFKEDLKKALQDEEIRQVLRDILSARTVRQEDTAPTESFLALEKERDSLSRQLQEAQEKNTGLSQRVTALERQLQAAQQENAGLTSHTLTLERDRDSLSQQLQEAKQTENGLRGQLEATLRQGLEWENQLKAERQQTEQLRKQLEQREAMCRPFQPLLACYTKYCALPEPVPQMLSPVLPMDSPVRFWVSGCQFNTLLLVWDAVKRQLEELSPESVRVLTDVLDFFIGQYNSIWVSPIYQLMTDETGASFDQERHIRSSDCSRYQGNVQKVLLPGIWNLNKKSAERRCVVWF